MSCHCGGAGAHWSILGHFRIVERQANTHTSRYTDKLEQAAGHVKGTLLQTAKEPDN